MTVFSSRMNNDLSTFGRRLNNQARTFGMKHNLRLGDINSGLHRFNEFANPALKFATLVNPELAPFTAVLGAGLNMAEQGTKYVARFEDGNHHKHKIHKPMLEK